MILRGYPSGPGRAKQAKICGVRWREYFIKINKLLSFALSTVALQACGGLGGYFSDSGYGGRLSEPEFVYCNGVDCPEAMGVIGLYAGSSSMKAGSVMGGCTGFLVSEDVVATNAHCVPEEIRAPGSDCDNRLAIIFPRVGEHPMKKVKCDYVISASSPSGNAESNGEERLEFKPDYAFFKLKEVQKRRAFSLDGGGISDRQKLVTYVGKHSIDYSGSLTSTIEKIDTCTAVANSMAVPAYTSPESAVVSLTSCPIIPGNSGSPILNTDGKVLGVIQAIYGKKDDYGQLEVHLAIGTNFYCIDRFESTSPWRQSGTCSSDYKSMNASDLWYWYGDSFLESIKAAEESLEKKLIAAPTELNEAFLWKVEYEVLNPLEENSLKIVQLRPVPYCEVQEPMNRVSIEHLNVWEASIGIGSVFEKVKASKSIAEEIEYALVKASKWDAPKLWASGTMSFKKDGISQFESLPSMKKCTEVELADNKRVVRSTLTREDAARIWGKK